MSESVNHPQHYTQGGIEVIDFIVAKGFDKDYCLGNVLKYVSRAPYKGKFIEDLKKAKWYLDKRIELEELRLGEVTKDLVNELAKVNKFIDEVKEDLEEEYKGLK